MEGKLMSHMKNAADYHREREMSEQRSIPLSTHQKKEADCFDYTPNTLRKVRFTRGPM